MNTNNKNYLSACGMQSENLKIKVNKNNKKRRIFYRFQTHPILRKKEAFDLRDSYDEK